MKREGLQAAHSERGALAALSLSMMLSSLGTSVANVALPFLAQDFSASFQEVQWVVLAYLLAITTLIVGAGRLGDVIGRRRLLLAGILLFSLASSLCAAAPTLGLLVASRAAQGLGAAVMMSLTLAFVGETVPKARTGRAMGLLGAMSAVGTALGPSLGGVLIAGWGWSSAFFVNLPLGGLALFLAYRHLPGDRKGTGAWNAFDLPGTLLLAVVLGCYTLAMTVGHGWFGMPALGLLLLAAIGAIAFVRTERKAMVPLLQWTTFRDPVLTGSLLASLLVSMVIMGTLVVGPFHLSGVLALEPAAVGLVMSVGPLSAALTALPAGPLVDRCGAQPVTIAALAGLATGSILLALMPTEFGVSSYLAAIVVITGSYALFQTANNATALTAAPDEQRGVVSGALNLSRQIGLINGASILGAVFAQASMADGGAAGLRTTFLFAAGFIVAALVVVVGSRALATRQPVLE